MSERPWIAINGELSHGENAQVVMPQRYALAVERAGGVPVLIPPFESAEALEAFCDRIHGLLMTGGDDFDTERLGLGPVHVVAKPVPVVKQDFDAALVRSALGAGVPMLGICYGMQMMALVEGGTLHQHLPDDVPGCREHRGGVVHSVRVEEGSKLHGLVAVTELDVYSRHHQALASVGPAWRVCARDPEGLIEAVERPSETGEALVLGVQWHPELDLEGRGVGESHHHALFRGLVDAARVRGADQLARQGVPGALPAKTKK